MKLIVLGIFVFLLGAFARHFSPALARYRRLIMLAGAVLFLVGYVPRLAETFVTAFDKGRELRR